MILEKYIQYAVDHKKFLLQLQCRGSRHPDLSCEKRQLLEMEKTTEYYKYLGCQTSLADSKAGLIRDGLFEGDNASLVLNTGIHFGVEAGIGSEPDNIFQHFYHSHQFIELIYVHKGKYHHFIDGKEEYLQEGDLCLINPNCIHYDPIEGKEQIVYIGLPLFGFHSFFLENMEARMREFIEKCQDKEERKEHICFRQKYGNRQEVSSYFEAMAKEHYEKRMGSSYMILALVLRVLSIAFETCEVEYTSQSSKKVAHKFFCRIEEYCRKHLDHVTKGEIQKAFFLTGSQINAIFRNELNTTFSRYLIQIRMEKARELIEQGKGTIEKVMAQVGYSNRTYFYKKFTEINGTSPGSLKKIRKGYKKDK